jgi:predicted ATPase/DNA-binding CsgD family transcriptional regulator
MADDRADSGAGSALDPLVGRTRLLGELEAAISEHRLVTLTGTGGSGKTRLATAFLDQRPDGEPAWFVDLSGIGEVDRVASVVSATLQLPETAQRDADAAVVAFLTDREALLVLDNLEHLPDVGRLVERWLDRARGLRIVGTSRVPLRVTGEIELHVPPLDLPADSTPDAVEQSAAGQLFLRRARSIGRLADLDADSAADVVTLLRRLDGLPLALELAAARTRILAPKAILARLDDPATLTARRHHDDRVVSLEAVLAWSVELLTPVDRDLLAAVAVCAGSFDLETCAALRPTDDILAALETLVANGLAVADGEMNGEPRFRLLETVRAHARRRLSTVDLRRLRHRLAEFLSGRFAALDPTTSFWAGFDRIKADDVTITDLIEGRPTIAAETALRLAVAAAPWWLFMGRLRDPERWLADLSGQVSDRTIRARGILALAAIRRELSGTAAVVALQEEALAIARAVDDPRLEIDALVARANALAGVLDPDARNWLTAALGIAERLELHHEAATIRVMAARARFEGEDPRDRRNRLLDVLEEAGRLGGPALVGTLTQLAVVEESLDLLDDALGHAERAADLVDVGGDAGRRWWVSATRGSVLAKLGRQDGARSAILDAMRLVSKGVTDPRPRMTAIVLLSAIAHLVATDRNALAVRCYGAAHGALDQIGERIAESDARMDERLMARARRSLGAIGWELAAQSGRRSGAWALVEEVIAELSATPSTIATGRGGMRSEPVDRSITARHGGLTRREVEVLGLVAEGRSDPEIGRALFISAKTASVHVANAKGKLGAATRLELALHARRLGLASGEMSDGPAPDDAASS